jgi:hypothetical protein
MSNNIFKLIIYFVFSSIPNCFSNPISHLIFNGVIKNYDGPQINTLINIYSNDSLISTSRSNPKGEFSMPLPLNQDYYIVFKKLNHFEKWVKIEAKGVNGEHLHSGFKFKKWEIFLQPEDERTEEFYTTVGGRIFFDEDEAIFGWEVYEILLPASIKKLINEDVSKKPQTVFRNSPAVKETKPYFKKVTSINKTPGKITDVNIEEFERFSRLTIYLLVEDHPVSLSCVKFNYGETFYFKNETPLTKSEFLGFFRCILPIRIIWKSMREN